MRTAGLMMNDVWADRVVREHGVQTHRYEGLEAEIGVLVDTVDLRHRGPDENFRPYLHLTGELRSVTPHDGLPYGISQVTYSAGRGEKVDAFYEFDDQQMVALARKGYFNSVFSVPEDRLTGVEWELPARMDALVLAPADEQDAPVIFVRVHDIGNLEVGLESSQYDLTDYFDDVSKNGIGREEKVVDARGLKARSDAINSLFDQDELGLDLLEQAERIQPGPVDEPVGGMAAGVRAIEADIEAQREQFVAEREHAEGTPEKLYRDRVAAALEQEREESVAPLRPARALSTDLDFAEEAEPGPTMAEREEQAARRAADLDFGEDGQHGLGS